MLSYRLGTVNDFHWGFKPVLSLVSMLRVSIFLYVRMLIVYSLFERLLLIIDFAKYYFICLACFTFYNYVHVLIRRFYVKQLFNITCLYIQHP